MDFFFSSISVQFQFNFSSVSVQFQFNFNSFIYFFQLSYRGQNLDFFQILFLTLSYITSAENPNWHTESDGRWFTSRVISRIKSNLVQTKGGPYCLEGKMNFQLAFSYGTPQFILSAFKSGFPENWDMYREQWRKFTKQQRGMIIFIVNLLAT